MPSFYIAHGVNNKPPFITARITADNLASLQEHMTATCGGLILRNETVPPRTPALAKGTRLRWSKLFNKYGELHDSPRYIAQLFAKLKRGGWAIDDKDFREKFFNKTTAKRAY